MTKQLPKVRDGSFLNEEFTDEPTFSFRLFVYWMILSLFASLFVFIVMVPGDQRLQLPLEMILALTIVSALFILFDQKNLAGKKGFDIPISPAFGHKFTDMELLFIYVLLLAFHFWFANLAVGGLSVAEQTSKWGVFPFMTAEYLSISPNPAYTIITTQFQILGETVVIILFANWLARRVFRGLFNLPLIINNTLLTIILFLIISTLFNAVIAPSFHWTAHDISWNNLGNALPSAILFSIFSLESLFFGAPAALFAHSGHNLGATQVLGTTISLAFFMIMIKLKNKLNTKNEI